MTTASLHLRAFINGILECANCGSLWVFTRQLHEVEVLDEVLCRRCSRALIPWPGSIHPICIPVADPNSPRGIPMLDKAAVIEQILQREGGWSDSEAAQGRPTNWGWTLTQFRNVKNDQTLSEDDLRALTREEAGELHWQEFFVRTRIAGIQNGALADAVADMAVNSGPANAIKALQRALGFTGDAVDGVLGTITMHSIPTDGDRLTRIFLAERMEFLGRWAAGDLADADRDGVPDRLENLPGILNRVGKQMRAVA